MDEAKGNRQLKKRNITTRINTIRRYVAEECDIKVLQEKKDQLKTAFIEFEEAHEAYELCLKEEKDLNESEVYYTEVQNNYIKCLETANEYGHKVKSDIKVSEESPAKQSDSQSLQLAAVNLPKLEIESFNGDPMKYHSFISTFEETVERYCDDGGARLTRLLQFTEGQARKAISACAVIGGSEGYAEARRILLERFGHDHIVSETMTSRLRSKKPAHNRRDIQELADDVMSCFLTLRQTGRLQEIDTQNTIMDIVDRLPKYVQNRWRNEAVNTRRHSGTYPGIRELLKFIKDIADEVNDPVYGYKESDPKPRPLTTSSRTYVAQDTSSQPRDAQRKCQVCDKQHGIWACDEYKKMPLSKRWEAAKSYHLCFRCLGRGHGGKTCFRSRTCGLDGCQQSHHRLLHGTKDTSVPTSPVPLVTGTQVQEEPVTFVTSPAQVVSSFVALRTIPVYLSNGRRHVKVNALIDEASTRTYLNGDIALELGLKGDV